MIERKICLTTDSILPSEKEQLTFLSVPPKTDSNESYTYVTEVGHGAYVCPRGMYCLHLTKNRQNTSDTTLQKSFETLMPLEKQKTVWLFFGFYFMNKWGLFSYKIFFLLQSKQIENYVDVTSY